MQSWNLKAAHAHCMANEAELLRSSICGCFDCVETFAPTAVTEWVDDKNGRTALCPKCGIDSVLGDASGYPVAAAEFLNAMNKRWFGLGLSTEPPKRSGEVN
jgi:hypothetical protein